MENSFGEQTGFHRFRDAARTADGIDRAHLILMPAIGRRYALQIHAQRGAVERVFDIVNSKRVSGAKHIHVSALDQFLQMLGRAGVHHGRAGYQQRLFPIGARALEFAGGFSNDYALRLLDRDIASDELESVRSRN